MTPLAAGWLLVDPASVGLLAGLLREGSRSVSGRRRLTPVEAAIVQAAELATYDARNARSGPGTVAVQGIAAAPSWLTAEQAAKELNVSAEYVRRLARGGALVAERHGHAWMVGADSVAAHSRRTAA